MVRLTKHSLRTLECQANLLILWENIRLVGTKNPWFVKRFRRVNDLHHPRFMVGYGCWMISSFSSSPKNQQRHDVQLQKNPVGLSKGKNRWNLWHWGHRGNLHIFPPPSWTLRGFQPLKKNARPWKTRLRLPASGCFGHFFLVGDFNPFENICSSIWIISPNRDEHKKKIWVATT